MSPITFLTTVEDRLSEPDGVYRAGGTDLQERLHTRNESPHVYDLTGIEALRGIERTAEGARIGALTTIAEVARELRDDYPALAASAGGLATPQIRSVGTVGGNLLQRTRCWYFRNPHVECFKTGGVGCPAREGRHLYGVVFDESRCVHPHPSTLGMALLTYDAGVTLAGGSRMSVAELFGDGVDPTRDHRLPDGEILVSIELPPPWEGERAAHFRSISRFEAEWPAVEAVVRVRLDGEGRVAACGLGLGGVATVPLRMREPEEMLRGSRLDRATIAAAAGACVEGARPLPETGYKVALVESTVREVLERVADPG